MDATRITYIEEANELLENLEAALLLLETNSSDTSTIEEVFRVMHTLKGNSSMFGFSTIAEFVHDLETIYDQIRSGEKVLSKPLLDCSFRALDHLKKIVRDPSLHDGTNREQHQALMQEIAQFIDAKSTNSPRTIVPAANRAKTYHIYFDPGARVFDNGTNPLYLLAELASLGNCKPIAHFRDTPSLTDFDPTQCITYWDIFLDTEKSPQEIRDVFVFVEDRAKIEITAMPDFNFLGNGAFLHFVQSKTQKDERIQLEEFYNSEAYKESQLLATQDALRAAREAGQKEKQVASIRVASEKLDDLMRMVSELVTTQASLSLYAKNSDSPELEVISENIEKLSRQLRDIAFGMTLIPINNLFGRFQRMVRDVAGNLGKEIEFVTEGGETELDKTIIERLADPLMHILRNSLDHGIEMPEERLSRGKAKAGKLVLKAYYSGAFIYIQVKDDGKGIDVDAVRQKAISKGLIRDEEVLTEKQLFDFIFHAGFSTAQKVTDVSGRGVGMDVVKRNIADIRGTIQIDSVMDAGTTLTIRLPLTLSIIDGLLVKVENVHYILPLSAIAKCFEVKTSDTVHNFNRLLVLDGEQVPFINTREEFGYAPFNENFSQLIVVNSNERKVGITVDAIVGEYQAVVKPLGKYYRQQEFISGASILGDGTIALVLDTLKMIELHITKLQKDLN